MNRTYKLGAIIFVLFSIATLFLYLRQAGPSGGQKFDGTGITVIIIDKLIQKIKKEQGQYPPDKYGLDFIYKNVNNSDNWKGPYALRYGLHIDEWGESLIYNLPSVCGKKTKNYDLYSKGENGIDECMSGDDIFLK